MFVNNKKQPGVQQVTGNQQTGLSGANASLPTYLPPFHESCLATFHHELNSSLAVGSSGRSKCNLLVLLSRVTFANIQQPNPPQDTWQFGLQLRSKHQGTSNGPDNKILAWVHDVVLRSNSGSQSFVLHGQKF